MFDNIFCEQENGPQLIQHYINSLLNQIYPLIAGLAKIRMIIKECLNIPKPEANTKASKSRNGKMLITKA